jgi:feruloyl esterase
LNYADNALQRGFAVVSTDSGHNVAVDNNPNALGAVSFGMDPQARLDMGFNSYDPGFHIPKLGIDGAWVSKAFAAIATSNDPNGAPLINKTFSDPDLLLLRQAVLERCDALDGVADGLVANSTACQAAFDPQTAVLPSGQPLQCPGAKTDSCLTSAQLVALKTALQAPVNGSGQPLYSDWPWDAGFGGIANGAYNQTWRSWWLGTYDSSVNTSQRLNGPSAQSWLIDWASPPIQVPVTGVASRILAFDFDVDAPKIFATSGIYTTSAADFDIYDSTDLSAFKAHGGKLIMLTPMVNWIEHGTPPASVPASATTPGRW